jgi:hypothetical protein
MTATSRWLKSIVPVTSRAEARLPIFAATTRNPRLCRAAGSTATVGAAPALPPSAYRGTSCISMKGDLPGLSNFWLGNIGSYQ